MIKLLQHIDDKNSVNHHTTDSGKKKVTFHISVRYNEDINGNADRRRSMNVKIGLSTAAFYGQWEVEEAAARLYEYGAECAEVFLQTRSEYTREFARLTREKLNGLPCASVHPMGTTFENEFFGRSARQRADALDMLRRVLDAAAELGAHLYVYHGRYSPARVELPFDARQNAEVVARMQEEAAQRNIAIAWENVCWCQLTTPERVRTIRKLLPQIRFTLDIKQAMRAGCDPLDFADAMGPQLANVHVCDWDEKGRLCLPGEGAFDFETFMRALIRTEYRGAMIVEPYLALVKSDEALADAIAYLKRTAEQACKSMD